MCVYIYTHKHITIKEKEAISLRVGGLGRKWREGN